MLKLGGREDGLDEVIAGCEVGDGGELGRGIETDDGGGGERWEEGGVEEDEKVGGEAHCGIEEVCGSFLLLL